MTNDLPRERRSLELAETARGRFEATEAAAERLSLDPGRISDCSEELLDRIHRSPDRGEVLWILEIAAAMLTAVMAVNREPLPVSEQVDPAAFALASLRDLAAEAAGGGLDYSRLENAAAGILKSAAAQDYDHQETLWGINRATASCELARARALVEDEEDDPADR